MATDLNIFDQFGNISQAAITDEAIASLTDDERAALINVVEKDDLAKQAERRAVEARQRHAEAARAHAGALKTYNALVPPISQAELVRQNIGFATMPKSANELKKIASDLVIKARKLGEAVAKADTDEAAAEAKAKHAEATAKANAAVKTFEKTQATETAKGALDEHAKALEVAEMEYRTASATVKPARVAQGEAIAAWIKLTRKLSALDVARDYQRRSAADAMAKAKANPEPEHKVWPVETALANRKAAEKATRAPRQLFTTR